MNEFTEITEQQYVSVINLLLVSIIYLAAGYGWMIHIKYQKKNNITFSSKWEELFAPLYFLPLVTLSIIATLIEWAYESVKEKIG